jgi:rhamnosyl/mannosyltransferase
MACGTPVVNTALPTGVPNVARDGREGLTVPAGDKCALATALRRILDEPGLRDELSGRSRERARDAFSGEAFIRQVGDVYQQALQ